MSIVVVRDGFCNSRVFPALATLLRVSRHVLCNLKLVQCFFTPGFCCPLEPESVNAREHDTAPPISMQESQVGGGGGGGGGGRLCQWHHV